MRTGKFKLRAMALALLALPLVTTPALAVDYYLKAQLTTVDMPDPSGAGTVQVKMWGYARCDNQFVCGSASVPGPRLTVPAGDTTLAVHLLNGLDQPTSIVINGLFKPMTPVWDNGAAGARPSTSARVRSFDAEAAPGAQADYTWNNVKPGTYLYQSGTQPQVQVQMGLYGAATKNAVDIVVVGTPNATPARGQAYTGAAYTFDNEATLLYSEIDPDFHKAVTGGGYGVGCAMPNWAGTTPPSTCVTSTFDYKPKYFLVNGQPYTFGAPVIDPAPVGNPGNTLLRVLNAGLTTHVPMIQGKLWDIVAEDGKPYPYKRTQYTALLPAAKTLDMLLTPEVGGGLFPIIDRRLSLSNAGVPDVGGMLAFLQFSPLTTPLINGVAGYQPASTPPTAKDDAYDTVAGVPLEQPANGVLVNDNLAPNGNGRLVKAVAASGTTSGDGSYVLSASGAFRYTPKAGFSGSDSFSYRVTDGQALSAAAATVTIAVTVPAQPVPAAIDNFAEPPGRATLNTEACADCWKYVSTTTGGASLVVTAGQAAPPVGGGGGRALYKTVNPATQAVSITSPSLADTALILKASGGTLPESPANFIRVSCESGSANTGELVVATMTGSSDAASFVKQATFPALACKSGGTLTAQADSAGVVTAWLGGSFVGGVRLPNVGAWTGVGRVGIQLLSATARISSVNATTP